MPPSHVLVPLDGSPLATDALDHAIETFDCRITVLNIVTPLDGGMSEGSALGVEQDRVDDARDRVTELVEAARRRAYWLVNFVAYGESLSLQGTVEGAERERRADQFQEAVTGLVADLRSDLD